MRELCVAHRVIVGLMKRALGEVSWAKAGRRL